MSHHYKETDNNLQNSQTPQFPKTPQFPNTNITNNTIAT